MTEKNKDLKALVIDDEKEITRFFKLYLGSYDCKTECIETCAEGIKKIKEDISLYDFVITDLWQEPSGIDVIKAVEGSKKPIPVYVMTCGAKRELEEEAKKLVGEDHFIRKPIPNLNGLCARITEEVRKQKYK